MIDDVVVQVISINILNIVMLAILNVFYFLKPRIERIEHTIFGRMLLFSFFGSLSGLLFGLITSIEPSVNIITILLEKIYNIFIIDWIILLGFYTYVISTTKEIDTNRLSGLIDRVLFFSLLLLLVPVNISVVDKKIMVTGLLLNLTFIISGIVLLSNLVMILKNVKHIKEKKYVPIYMMIILSILFIVIQAANPDFNYLNSLLGMLIGYLMYFTIENPDVRMIEELTKAQQLSEKTTNDKSNFLYTISNDIVNRLDKIDSIYQNIEAAKSQEEAVFYLEQLKEILASSRNMLRKTIDISDMDAIHLQTTNNKYNLKLLLESVYSLNKKDINKPIDFRLSLSDDLPTELYGDSIKLKQILSSVINNSIKYTNEGSIEFRISSIIKNDIARLFFTVEDTGKGIDIFKQNEIMNDNHDLEKEEIENLDSMNLNLKTIRKMINIIGGTFTIDSNSYGGTTVNITLDQRMVIEEKSKEEQNIEKYSEAIKSQKTCAIITLDKNESKTIKNIAKRYYKVSEFNVTKNCLDNVRNGNNYDLIFIDEYMEKIDARTLLTKLKEVETFNGKVMVITKNKDIRLKKELLDLGFDSIVYLPIDKKELNNKLKNN